MVVPSSHGGNINMLTKYALVAVIVLCLTVLGFTLLVGDSLCEFTVKERNIEFRLFSLTNRRSSRCAGSNPRISGCQVRMVRHLLYTFARGQ
ncbi:type I toxin-antitoxin system Hok family toxin [Escherichia coli]|nr:type I toxin-antitoxin system Hok family toxin [Escherichia coli]